MSGISESTLVTISGVPPFLRMVRWEQGILSKVHYEFFNQAVEGGIFLGKVSRIAGSLNAAFVDIGQEKKALLTLPAGCYPSQRVVVQVTKTAYADKGAILTDKIRFSSKNLVFFPYEQGVSVSKKIAKSKKAQLLCAQLVAYFLQKNISASIIIRTNAIACSFEEIKQEFLALYKQFEIVLASAKQARIGDCLFQKQQDWLAVLTDWLRLTTDQIWVDNFVLRDAVMPVSKVFDIPCEQKEAPLLNVFDKKSLLTQFTQKEIPLDNGGNIVIEHAQAMTIIDVNSGANIREKNAQKNYLTTNLLATDAIMQHILLRNICGIILIDFIDMSGERNKQKILQKLQKLLSEDKQTKYIGEFSALGLVEISRKRQGVRYFEKTQNIYCVNHRVEKELQTQDQIIKIYNEILWQNEQKLEQKVIIQLSPVFFDYCEGLTIDAFHALKSYTKISLKVVRHDTLPSLEYRLQFC